MDRLARGLARGGGPGGGAPRSLLVEAQSLNGTAYMDTSLGGALDQELTMLCERPRGARAGATRGPGAALAVPPATRSHC